MAVAEGNLQVALEAEHQIAECKEHAEAFAAVLARAEKRFAALARVEKRHAEAYQQVNWRHYNGTRMRSLWPCPR